MLKSLFTNVAEAERVELIKAITMCSAVFKTVPIASWVALPFKS